MIIGNAAWGFRLTPLEEQLKLTSDMGLIILELSMGNSEFETIKLDLTENEIDDVKLLFNKYNIELRYGSVSNDFTTGKEEDCKSDLENIKKGIDLGNKLGLEIIRIFAGFSHEEDVINNSKRWNLTVKYLNLAAEYAKNKNVILSIETHGGVQSFDTGIKHFHSITTKINTFKKLLSEIDNSLMVNFDPANLYAVGIENPEEFYNQIKDKVNYVHLKDFSKIKNSDMIKPSACGESTMDWDLLMKYLEDYKGPGFIEYENTEDFKSGFERSYEFLKKYI